MIESAALSLKQTLLPMIESAALSLKQTLLPQLQTLRFIPHPALANPHSQTIWPAILHRIRRPLPFRCERFITPDGDTLQLQHRDLAPNSPRLLLLHGLEGDARSSSPQIMARAAQQFGWNVTVLEFRGCGGPLNSARRLYHSGETTDIHTVAHALRARSDAPLYAMGFSLGANVLGKWLGEQGHAACVDAAVLVSAPFDLTAAGPMVDRALGGFYSRLFLKTLLPKALAKERQFPGCIDARRASSCRTLVEYDDTVTAPLHGFANAREYYEKNGCGQVLAGVRRPTLLISAEDDPLIPGASLPREAADRSPFLVPIWTRRGGHLGFVGSRREAWFAPLAVRFFQGISGTRK